MRQKQERYKNEDGTDWIDDCAANFTPEEFQGAMKFVIGKYKRRMGKKDDVALEEEKIADYEARWAEYNKRPVAPPAHWGLDELSDEIKAEPSYAISKEQRLGLEPMPEPPTTCHSSTTSPSTLSLNTMKTRHANKIRAKIECMEEFEVFFESKAGVSGYESEVFGEFKEVILTSKDPD